MEIDLKLNYDRDNFCFCYEEDKQYITQKIQVKNLKYFIQEFSNYPINEKTLIHQDYIARKIFLQSCGFGKCCIGSPEENIAYNYLCESFYNRMKGKLKPINFCYNFGLVPFFASCIDLVAFNEKSKQIELYNFRLDDDNNQQDLKIYGKNIMHEFLDNKFTRDSLEIEFQKKILQDIKGVSIGNCYIVYFDKKNKVFQFKRSQTFSPDILSQLECYIANTNDSSENSVSDNTTTTINEN